MTITLFLLMAAALIVIVAGLGMIFGGAEKGASFAVPSLKLADDRPKLRVLTRDQFTFDPFDDLTFNPINSYMGLNIYSDE